MIETGHSRAEVNVAVRTPQPVAKSLARNALALFSPALLWGTGSIVGGLVIWEAIYRLFHVSPLVLSPPSAIAAEFAKLTADGTLAIDIATSAQQFFIGYIVAAAIAVGIGLLFGVNRTFRYIADPWVQALYATPTVSLAPLFIIWLGFGLESKAMIVGLLVFFPVLINTAEGVRSLDVNIADVADAFGSTKSEYFWKVVLPATQPHIFTGLRLAVARGIIGLVVGDLFGSNKGLGYLILNASQLFNTPMLFVGTVILAIAGVVLTGLLTVIERAVSPWTRVKRT
jgi:ABC-type nitrate/sulfonate/bicarbonate transport system permease component